jgi:cytoskeleton protein RodZ
MPRTDAAAPAGSRGGVGADVVRTAGLGNDRVENAANIAGDTPSDTPSANPNGSAGDDTFVLAIRGTAPPTGRSSDVAVVKRPAPAPRPPPTITATVAGEQAPGADTEAETSPEAQAPAAEQVVGTPWPPRLAVQTAPSTSDAGDLPPPLPSTTGASSAARRTDTGAASGGYVPQVYGIGNSEARVVVHATMDSWVQIRGGGNELLLTRILRAGDRYLAPDRADLLMMTGNAGGLEIRVDGKALPPIGPVGAVKRNVSLYVENLLRRNPVAQ